MDLRQYQTDKSAKVSILMKIARNFDEKIQIKMKSVQKKCLFKKIHLYLLKNLLGTKANEFHQWNHLWKIDRSRSNVNARLSIVTY